MRIFINAITILSTMLPIKASEDPSNSHEIATYLDYSRDRSLVQKCVANLHKSSLDNQISFIATLRSIAKAPNNIDRENQLKYSNIAKMLKMLLFEASRQRKKTDTSIDLLNTLYYYIDQQFQSQNSETSFSFLEHLLNSFYPQFDMTRHQFSEYKNSPQQFKDALKACEDACKRYFECKNEISEAQEDGKSDLKIKMNDICTDLSKESKNLAERIERLFYLHNENLTIRQISADDFYKFNSCHDILSYFAQFLESFDISKLENNDNGSTIVLYEETEEKLLYSHSCITNLTMYFVGFNKKFFENLNPGTDGSLLNALVEYCSAKNDTFGIKLQGNEFKINEFESELKNLNPIILNFITKIFEAYKKDKKFDHVACGFADAEICLNKILEFEKCILVTDEMAEFEKILDFYNQIMKISINGLKDKSSANSANFLLDMVFIYTFNKFTSIPKPEVADDLFNEYVASYYKLFEEMNQLYNDNFSKILFTISLSAFLFILALYFIIKQLFKTRKY